MSESSYYCHEAGTNCNYVDYLSKELQKSNWHSEQHLINIQSLNKTISELSNMLNEAEKLLQHGEGVCFKCQDNAVMYVPISSIAGYEQGWEGECQTK